VKAVKGQLDRAIAAPDPAIRFYLFHGADDAGSRALALKLLRGLGNAEKFIVLGQAVKADPASLGDEAGAMALFGGPRALWIEPAGDEITEGVASLLDASGSESAVIALAGPLRKTSSLLKLAESHPRALSHVSYVPEGREMEQIVADIGRGLGLRLSPDVAQRVAGLSANNQAIVASELEKFALFLGASPDRPRELDHDTIEQIGADGSESDWQRLGDLALSGRMDVLIEELGRLPSGGAEAIPAVRALQRRLTMLAPLRARVEQGERVDAVMTSMGKSLFWKDKPVVQRLLSNWSARRLAEAAERVVALERELMLGDSPSEAALGETLVTLARVGARRA
jgi:DNA polymerase-3 subunit delta